MRKVVSSARTGARIAEVIQREGETVSALSKDIRIACRTLWNNPGFTLVAVLILALGIAANSTIFSWISSTILDPIPGGSRTGDLVSVMKGEWSSNPVPPFSYADYVDVSARTQSFSGVLGYHDFAVALTGKGNPERVSGVFASVNYFDVLQVRPFLGRGFLPAEGEKPGAFPVALISYRLWENRFAADRSILGKSIEINRRSYTIVGVTPPAFHGCKLGLASDVWVPLAMEPTITGWKRYWRRDVCWLQLIGRLKRGTSRQQAETETNLLMEQIVKQYPAEHLGANQITIDPLWRSPFGAGYGMFTGFSLLQALAAVLLLLACANVGNLMLVRSVERRREIAIRLSVGASQWQLLRQFLVESLLLALLAAGAALAVTAWTARSLSSLIPPSHTPSLVEAAVDVRVLVATLLIAVLSSLLIGILPALRSSRVGSADVLKEEAGAAAGGLHRSRLARGLVVAQIALSFLLLICAGLFLQSYRNTLRADPGFDPRHLLLCSLDLLPTGATAEQGKAFQRQLLARLEALPGVESATLANWVPFAWKHTQDVLPKGYVPRPHESMEVWRANVGPNYFQTLRIPLAAGRDISVRDTDTSQPVVVVNEAFAQRYWSGQDALGKQVQAYGRWFTVVGVARNTKCFQMRELPYPMIFLPLSQVYYHDAVVHVRVAGDPNEYRGAVEKTVHELNAEVPLFNVASLEEVVERSTTAQRIGGELTSILGMLALTMAAVGIYGVIAYATRQRTHELGIRMALGARPSSICALVVGQGIRLTLAGLGIGVLVAYLVGSSLKNLLFGIGAGDARTFAVVAVVLCLVALVACFIPARRAAAGNPITALRHD